MNIIEKIEKEQLEKLSSGKHIPDFNPGDTITFKNISKNVHQAEKEGFTTNVYLEDWSNGMSNSKEYVFQYLDFLTQLPVSRILLPDTLGVLTPEKTYCFINEIVNRYPKIHFDFHGHNDYDLGVSNTLEAE